MRSILPLLSGILLVAACRETPLPVPGPADVTFSLRNGPEGTRMTGIDPDDEVRVGDWVLLVYRDGRLAGWWGSPDGAPISCKLETDDYHAFAVVNPPSSFRPSSMTDLSTLAEATCRLEENRPDRLLMAGGRDFTVPASGISLSIGVDRLVCKAGFGRISVDFSQPSLAGKTFLLKAVYLTNCYGLSRYAGDMSVGEIQARKSFWHNPMGFSSQAGTDPLLADLDIDTDITAAKPYGTPHAFYCFPNPLGPDEDSREPEWSPRCTRMVIEAAVNGRTCYYAISLPQLERNKTYLADTIRIKSLGSSDPEEEKPGAVEVSLRTLPGDWAPEYQVHETS